MRWLQQARPKQLPPSGPWSIWYVRGGRGAGKTRTGAETLAHWLLEYPGEYAIVAPTSHDVKSVCVEGSSSGLLKCLGGERGGLIRNWNRSEGVVYLENGGKVFTDGADDGAFRIQGKNLHGAWCDEVGLWQKWETSWNYSLRPAIRFEPALIVATGTPKMGHPLISYLLAAPDAVSTHMPTAENIENLYGSSIEAMMREWQGTTLGRQELEGEFIEALEGEILQRSDWRLLPALLVVLRAERGAALRGAAAVPADRLLLGYGGEGQDHRRTSGRGRRGVSPAPTGCCSACSMSTPGSSRDCTMIRELTSGRSERVPRVAVRSIVEAAGLGPDIVKQLEREAQGLRAIAAKGDKVQRAWAASPALESHHCVLPGESEPAGGLATRSALTPTAVQKLVDECALFRADMKHAHDDQVDAWSQMVNWTRAHAGAGGRVTAVPQGRIGW